MTPRTKVKRLGKRGVRPSSRVVLQTCGWSRLTPAEAFCTALSYSRQWGFLEMTHRDQCNSAAML